MADAQNPGHDRRAFLRTLAGCGLLPLLGGCRGRPPLRIASGIWQGYEFLFLAQRQGWYNEAGVQIVEMASNAGSLRALAAGVVHGAALTLDEVLRARVQGLPLTIVLVFDVSAGADLLLARAGIDHLSQLEGKRIGYAKGTNADLLLALALQRAGLAPSQVTLVNLAFGDQLAGWRSNRVDALVTYNPVAATLLAEGAVNLFDSRQAPNAIVDVLALHRDVIDEPAWAEQIRTLLAGHFRAMALWRERPAEVAALMARHLGLAEDGVQDSYQGLKLVDLLENRQLLGGERPGLLVSARSLLYPLARSGLVHMQGLPANLVDDRFLPG